MSQLKRYVITFVKAAVYFGFFMCLVVIFQNYFRGNEAFLSIGGGVFAGFLFGFFVVLLEFISDRMFKKKGISYSNSNINQKRKIKINKNISDIVSSYKGAILSLNKAKILREDIELILVKTGVSWKRFGEMVSISATALNDENTIIEIASRPSLRLTMMDYGKNSENVELLVRATLINFQNRIPLFH